MDGWYRQDLFINILNEKNVFFSVVSNTRRTYFLKIYTIKYLRFKKSNTSVRFFFLNKINVIGLDYQPPKVLSHLTSLMSNMDDLCLYPACDVPLFLCPWVVWGDASQMVAARWCWTTLSPAAAPLSCTKGAWWHKIILWFEGCILFVSGHCRRALLLCFSLSLTLYQSHTPILSC